MNLIENTYGSALRLSFSVLNPFKKMIIHTQCEVHKKINFQALKILKNDYHTLEYNFFKDYISDINEGAVWTDQDFKSSNHFYNPRTKKGLYGRSNAMDLAVEYNDKCIALFKMGDLNRAMFYFGATIHLLQDMTIPQHANIRLLDDHRQYENFVKSTYRYVQEYNAETGAYHLHSLEHYIKFNARVAMKVYHQFRKIKDDQARFQKISHCTLPLAERTTAGYMVLFFNKMCH